MAYAAIVTAVVEAVGAPDDKQVGAAACHCPHGSASGSGASMVGVGGLRLLASLPLQWRRSRTPTPRPCTPLLHPHRAWH